MLVRVLPVLSPVALVKTRIHTEVGALGVACGCRPRCAAVAREAVRAAHALDLKSWAPEEPHLDAESASRRTPGEEDGMFARTCRGAWGRSSCARSVRDGTVRPEAVCTRCRAEPCGCAVRLRWLHPGMRVRCIRDCWRPTWGAIIMRTGLNETVCPPQGAKPSRAGMRMRLRWLPRAGTGHAPRWARAAGCCDELARVLRHGRRAACRALGCVLVLWMAVCRARVRASLPRRDCPPGGGVPRGAVPNRADRRCACGGLHPAWAGRALR